MKSSESPDRARRNGRRIALLIVIGMVVLPASATAGPVESIAQRTTLLTAAADQATNGAETAIRQTVEQSTARVAPIVRAATGPDPVRATVRAVSAPIGEVAPRTGAAVAAVADPPRDAAPSPGRAGGQPGGAGGIDRRADRQAGGASARSFASDAGVPTAATALPSPVTAIVLAERPRSDASSSTSAGGDDGDDRGFPPFGGDGGSNPLTGPVGIALLALGLLVALTLLVPRFTTRLLHMTPGHRRPVAFLVPIERPG